MQITLTVESIDYNNLSATMTSGFESTKISNLQANPNATINGNSYFNYQNLPNEPIYTYTVAETVAVIIASSASATNYRGVLNCGTNPNYPAGTSNDYWKISVAGKVGGGSGLDVEVGDELICIIDSLGGTQAAVGADYIIVQKNMMPTTVAQLYTGTDNLNFVTAKTIADAGITTSASLLSVAKRIFSSVAPTDSLTSSLGVGTYSTPVVDTAVVDNIACTINMSTATNKTVADTSSMAVFIGISNTAGTTNNKIQGLLVSNTLNGNCFDAYGVQGHITVANNMATQNANAHITGLSGNALLTANNTQGWVTGVLAIIDGTGTTGGLCHVIAGVLEATTTASQCDALCYLSAGQTVITAIELAGATNITNFLVTNAAAGFAAGGAVRTATPGDVAVDSAGSLLIKIGVSTYKIPYFS